MRVSALTSPSTSTSKLEGRRRPGRRGVVHGVHRRRPPDAEDAAAQQLRSAGPKEPRSRAVGVKEAAVGGQLIRRVHGVLEQGTVELSRLVQGALRLQLVGDVADGPDHVRRVAFLVSEHDSAVAHLDVAAVLTPQTVLATVHVAVAHRRLHEPDRLPAIVGMQTVEPRREGPRQSLGRQTDEGVHLRRELHVARADVPVVVRVVHGVHEGAEARLRRRPPVGARHGVVDRRQ